MKNRAAIFFFYDKDGIVDDYVTYFLSSLKECVSELVFVSNGVVNEEGQRKLKPYVSELLIRDNEGLDVGAYKDGINHIGWSKLASYDELVLCNHTMFGPLYPFKQVFEQMEQKELDFWGLTKHHSREVDTFGTCEYGYIPEHIQSSFIVIRNSMLKSKEYIDFWENMPKINSYSESVGKYEAIFTKKFSDLGFKHELFVETSDLDSITFYPLLFKPLELVKNRACPVIKRKSFFQDYTDFIYQSNGSPTAELYEYLTNNSSYDVNLIWDNILRTCNMSDIKKCMQLNYILPKECSIDIKVEHKKIAIFSHLYFEDLVGYMLNYINHCPKEYDVFLSVQNKKMRNIVESNIVEFGLTDRKITIIDIENRGRDVSALLVGFEPYLDDYDYVCFVHDKKTKQVGPTGLVGEEFSRKCMENLLASNVFIQNIVKTFDNEPRLGMLMPPPPSHGGFLPTTVNEWGANYKNVVTLAKKLGMSIDISEEKEPISPLGTMFWFRPDALRSIRSKTWTYSDFPKEPNGYDGTILHAIERLYGLSAQQSGYYVGWVLNDEFVKYELTSLYHTQRLVNKNLAWKGYYFNDIYALIISFYQNTNKKRIRTRIGEILRIFLSENSIYKISILEKKFRRGIGL